MPFPDAKVFIAFNDGPYVASPTWQEVTSYVRSITVSRGRADDLEDFPAGTAQLVLDNRDRLFDPFYDQTVLRTNLVTNPSFETNTTGWSFTTGVTTTRTSAQAYAGTWSVSQTRTSTTGALVFGFAPRLNVTENVTYTFSAYIRRDYSTSRTTQIRAQWFNAGGTIIGSTVTTAVTPPPINTWGRVSVTLTAPATATTVYFDVIVNNAVVGETMFFDAAMLEQSATVGEYFDGDTLSTGSPGVGRTAWTGTANNSTSTLSNYPNAQYLKPRRQIRIVGRANGVDYDVFRGYVAGWPVEWTEAGYDSTVTIQCFDALGLMANEVVPTDWVYEYTKSLNPRHYWRCDDSRGSQTLSDDGAVPLTMSLNNAALPYFFEQPPLAPGFNGNSAAVTNYWTSSIANAPTMPLEITDFAFTGWLQFAGIYGSVSAIEMVYKRITLTIEYYVRVVGSTPIGTFQVYIFTPTATKYWTSTVSPNAMAPYFFAVNFDAATQTVAFKINDVTATGTLTTSGGSGSTSLDYMRFQGIIVQDIAVYERKLTAAEQTALFNFGSGRILETTSARMARLRDTTDYPAALTSFTGSPVASVSEIGTGAGVIQELQLTADSEGGELYVSKTGVLTMTPRFGNFSGRSATSQATITDSGAGLDYGPELLIEYDADSLKNDITVTYSGDGEVNVYNDANITEYGGAATTIETYLDTPAAASALATAKSGVYGALVPRISPIDVSVNTAASDWQTILGLELLDRVTFKRTPSVGNQFDRAALIQGIDHQIEPGVWRTQLTLSMRYTSPLICDDPVRGRVDFNYCG